MSDELLESEVEGPACQYAIRRGWFRTKIMRGYPNGFPDDFFARNGEVLLIEFKRPGEQPNPQQKKRHRELRAAGIRVEVVDNLDDAKRLLR